MTICMLIVCLPLVTAQQMHQECVASVVDCQVCSHLLALPLSRLLATSWLFGRLWVLGGLV